jgi:Flp pilus assembly protein TadB
VDWLVLVGFGIMWAVALVPLGRRRRSERASVHDFERRMELLAQTELNANGRWIVTPRKGIPFVGTAERRRTRARERRRQVFTFLLESIGISFLIGLVPPLRVIWDVTMVLVVLLAMYVWLLLYMKSKDRVAPAHEQARQARRPETVRAVRAATPRFVADGRTGWARPTFNGLGAMSESDRVHVVVRRADPAHA